MTQIFTNQVFQYIPNSAEPEDIILNPTEILKTETLDLMFNYQSDLEDVIEPEVLDYIAYKLDQLLFNSQRIDTAVYFINQEFKESLQDQDPKIAQGLIQKSIFTQLKGYLKSQNPKKHQNTNRLLEKIKISTPISKNNHL